MLFFIEIVCLLVFAFIGGSHGSSKVFTSTSSSVTTDPDLIHLAVVACGTDRVEESMVMLKSAVLFTKRSIHLHLFADDDARPLFQKELEKWPEEWRRKYEYSIYKITYPPGEIDWKKVFKPCATQRLFIPYIIDPDIEKLLYVDTDILFLRPIEDLWAHFDKFNGSHAAALSPEHETPWSGWYNRFARHPYYGEMGVNSGVMLMKPSALRHIDWSDHMTAYFKHYEYRITWGDQDLINIFFHFRPGVNSGVMLMNCPKLRAGAWQEKMIVYYKTYRYNITWGDQDLINIYFHHFPEMLYVYPCEWNYRADHCMYGSVCKTAETGGANVLHGNRGYYHNDKQPAFKAVYQALRDYMFGNDMQRRLIAPLKSGLEEAKHSYCGKVPHILTTQLERQAAKQQEERSQETTPVPPQSTESTQSTADSESSSVTEEGKGEGSEGKDEL